jgi:hypothetical protein
VRRNIEFLNSAALTEKDERRKARHLRELSGRAKSARAMVSTTLGLTETLARDWKKVARFYARFGITAAMFRDGPTDCTFDLEKNC